MRISPETDAVSPQGEARGKALPIASRPEAKGIMQFREVMEETSVDEPGQRPRDIGRPKQQEPTSQHETEVDFAAAQGLIPAFLFGGRERQADLTVPHRQGTAATPPKSVSVSQYAQSHSIEEFTKSASKRMPQPAAVGHFLNEAGCAGFAVIGPTRGKTSSPPALYDESLQEDVFRTAGPAGLLPSRRDKSNAVEVRQDAELVSKETDAVEIQAEDKVKAGALTGAVSRDGPDSSTQPNSNLARDSDSAVVVRNAASAREEGTAGENAGGDNMGSRPSVDGQVESLPNMKSAEVGLSSPMSSGSFFPLSPAKQISEFISKTISATASSISYAASPDSPGREKTLYLELHPESIGRVRLTLQLRGDDLDIRIKAKSKEAAEAIEQDRSLLGRLLSEAGFRVSSQDIRIEAQATAGHDFHPGSQDNPGVLAQGSGNSSRNGAEKHEPSWQQTLKTGSMGNETPASADSGDARRSGVYL